MKTKLYLTLLLLLSILTFNACKKFLDTEPEGRLVLSKLQDYDLLLSGTGLSSGDYQLTEFMTDNVDNLMAGSLNAGMGLRIYLWADQFDLNMSQSPPFWGSHYANIYGYNAVVEQVERATTGTLQEKRKLKAEALMRRTFEYLYLVNLYAKPYNPLTASSDLALPYVTSTEISDPTPPRSTVSFIYQKIIEDILSAIPDLPANNNSNKFRGSVNAAYSILARTYYFMNDYANASKYAILALSEPGTGLLDYNTIERQEEIPLISISKQEIYARNSNTANTDVTGSGVIGTVSQDLDRLIGIEDSRLNLFYYFQSNTPALRYDRGSLLFANPIAGKINFGTSVVEMKLIIAEAAARNDDLSLALAHLNDILKVRYTTSAASSFSSADPEAVLQRVLKERRLELAFRGIRWLDMRKLDAANRMEPVKRLSLNGEVISTLEPHSAKYTLKIPTSVLHFNPEMPQN